MFTTMRFLKSRRTVRSAGAADLICPPAPRPQRVKTLDRVPPLHLSFRGSRHPVTSLASSTTRESSLAPGQPLSRLQLALRDLRAKTPLACSKPSTDVKHPAEASRNGGHLVLRSRRRHDNPPPPVSSTTQPSRLELAKRRLATAEPHVRQPHRVSASTQSTASVPTCRKSSLKQPQPSSRPKKSVSFKPTVMCYPVSKWIDKELDTRTPTEFALSRYLLPLEQTAAARARNHIRRVNPYPVPKFWPIVIS